jgi:hypothetical protein
LLFYRGQDQVILYVTHIKAHSYKFLLTLYLLIRFFEFTIIIRFIMKNSLYWLLIIASILGCKKDNEDNEDEILTTQPGQFALTFSSALKSALSPAQGDSASFFLDTIKSSRTFNFSLRNIGQEDISNISITSDNNSFTVFPSSIESLPGTGSNSNNALGQIISVDVIHGDRLNGVGFAGLLKMGNNLCHLIIQGKTYDGKSDTLLAKLTANITVYAKVLSVSLVQGDKLFDLSKPDSYINNGPSGISSLSQYEYKNAPPVAVKNTGNTKINLSVINEDLQNTVLQQSVLLPDDSLILDLPVNTGNGFVRAFLKLDSNGTIADKTKLNIGNDGCSYIALINNDFIPPVDTISYPESGATGPNVLAYGRTEYVGKPWEISGYYNSMTAYAPGITDISVKLTFIDTCDQVPPACDTCISPCLPCGQTYDCQWGIDPTHSGWEVDILSYSPSIFLIYKDFTKDLLDLKFALTGHGKAKMEIFENKSSVADRTKIITW